MMRINHQNLPIYGKEICFFIIKGNDKVIDTFYRKFATIHWKSFEIFYEDRIHFMR